MLTHKNDPRLLAFLLPLGALACAPSGETLTTDTTTAAVSADNSAEVVSHTLPASIPTSDSRAYQITMRNSGSSTWDSTYSLRISLPSGSHLWGLSARPISGVVAPGDSVTFDVFITAPAVAGTVPFAAQMYLNVPGNRGYFGQAASVSIEVEDGSPRELYASLASTTMPAQLAPSERRYVELVIANDGTTAWGANEVTLRMLGASGIQFGSRRLGAVPAGESVTVGLIAAAPSTQGATSLIGQVYVDRGFLGGYIQSRITIPVTIDAGAVPGYSSSVAGSVHPVSMTPGEVGTFEVELENTGSATWSQASFALDSVRPGASWGRSRVSLGVDVAPSESYNFSIDVVAPLVAGSYESRWQMRDLNTSGVGVFGAISSVLVEVGPPDTSITSAPVAETLSSTAIFELDSNQPGPSYECSIDAGAYAACVSPHQIDGLAPGEHTFAVRAVRNGFTDASPAIHVWTILPVTLTNGGFESGDYTGWVVDQIGGGIGAGTLGIAADGAVVNYNDRVWDFADNTRPYERSPGLPITYSASEGGYLAIMLINSPTRQRFYQDVTVPVCAETLAWDMAYENHYGSGFDAATHYIAIEVRSPGDDSVLATLYKTMPGATAEIPMTTFVADISAYAGQTIRVGVDSNVRYYLDAMFDDFVIQGCD